MSTRREFARQVIGAIVGVSAIPAFGQKPAPRLVAGFDPAFGKNFSAIVVARVTEDKFEIMGHMTVGSPPSPEHVRDMISNFKANINSLWHVPLPTSQRTV